MKLHEKIYDLFPFQSENFLRIPAWEDGCYIPSVNVWQIAKDKAELDKILNHIQNCETPGYDIGVDYDFNEDHRDYRIEIRVDPKHDYIDEKGYYCIKEDWSIDEMIDIAKKIVHPPNP